MKTVGGKARPFKRERGCRCLEGRSCDSVVSRSSVEFFEGGLGRSVLRVDGLKFLWSDRCHGVVIVHVSDHL